MMFKSFRAQSEQHKMTRVQMLNEGILYRQVDIYIYTHTHTVAQKFGISTIFNVVIEVSSAHQGCIYSIKNTEKL